MFIRIRKIPNPLSCMSYLVVKVLAFLEILVAYICIGTRSKEFGYFEGV